MPIGCTFIKLSEIVIAYQGTYRKTKIKCNKIHNEYVLIRIIENILQKSQLKWFLKSASLTFFP